METASASRARRGAAARSRRPGSAGPSRKDPAEPIRGVGIGLRPAHYSAILEEQPALPFLELLSDNYLKLPPGAPELRIVERIRERHPVVLHGVGLSIGSSDPLDRDYLERLRRLAERLEPAWVSDHCCWISLDGRYLHDLLPLPHTEETLRHTAERVARVQDVLGRRLVLENVSRYAAFAESELREEEFLAELCARADCELLLDVSNLYVSARNLGFDPHAYLRALPAARVRQLHLAGYEDRGRVLIDTHGERVHAPVWELFDAVLARFGPVPTAIEWDRDIPELPVLLDEARHAAGAMQRSEPQPSEVPGQAPGARSEAQPSGDQDLKLLDLQRRFVRELLGGATELRVYRENVLDGLAEALARLYPACQRIVGARFFHALARGHAAEFPSRSPDLDDYGAELPGFLQTFVPARALPYLPDLARLERACHAAQRAPEGAALDFRALAQVPREAHAELVFELAPSLVLLESPHPVHRIRELALSESSDSVVSLDEGAAHLAIWREGSAVRVEPLDGDSLALLESFARGARFEEVSASRDPEALAAQLHGLARLGLVSGFHLAGAASRRDR